MCVCVCVWAVPGKHLKGCSGTFFIILFEKSWSVVSYGHGAFKRSALFCLGNGAKKKGCISTVYAIFQDMIFLAFPDSHPVPRLFIHLAVFPLGLGFF